MLRVATNHFLITSALAKNFWPTVTSSLRHYKNKTLKNLPSTIRSLFLFKLVVVALFACTVDGFSLNRKQKMINAPDPVIFNREQFTSEKLPCRICNNARQLTSSLDAHGHYDVSETSETHLNRLSELIKNIRRVCGEQTYVKCRLLHQQMTRQENMKLHETKLGNNQIGSSDNVRSIRQQVVRSDMPSSYRKALPSSAKALSRRKRLASGDRRLVHMYCRTNFILEIKADGTVAGSRRKTANTALQIQAVQPGGVVRFYSPGTGYYLAMNDHGKLYGTKSYSLSKCAFKERLHKKMWTTYSFYGRQVRSDGRTKRSAKRPWYVAIGKTGMPRKANRIRASSKAAQFLPL